MDFSYWSKKRIAERGESHLPYITKEDVDKWLEDSAHWMDWDDEKEDDEEEDG